MSIKESRCVKCGGNLSHVEQWDVFYCNSFCCNPCCPDSNTIPCMKENCKQLLKKALEEL